MTLAPAVGLLSGLVAAAVGLGLAGLGVPLLVAAVLTVATGRAADPGSAPGRAGRHRRRAGFLPRRRHRAVDHAQARRRAVRRGGARAGAADPGRGGDRPARAALVRRRRPGIATAVATGRLAIAFACRRGVPAARPDGMGAVVAGTVGPAGAASAGRARRASCALAAGPGRPWLGPVAVTVGADRRPAGDRPRRPAPRWRHRRRARGRLRGRGDCVPMSLYLCHDRACGRSNDRRNVHEHELGVASDLGDGCARPDGTAPSSTAQIGPGPRGRPVAGPHGRRGDDRAHPARVAPDRPAGNGTIHSGRRRDRRRRPSAATTPRRHRHHSPTPTTPTATTHPAPAQPPTGRRRVRPGGPGGRRARRHQRRAGEGRLRRRSGSTTGCARRHACTARTWSTAATSATPAPTAAASGERLREAGYNTDRGWAENIARGYSSVAAVMKGWMNSDGPPGQHPQLLDEGARGRRRPGRQRPARPGPRTSADADDRARRRDHPAGAGWRARHLPRTGLRPSGRPARPRRRRRAEPVGRPARVPARRSHQRAGRAGRRPPGRRAAAAAGGAARRHGRERGAARPDRRRHATWSSAVCRRGRAGRRRTSG